MKKKHSKSFFTHFVTLSVGWRPDANAIEEVGVLGEGHGLEEFGNPWIRSEQMKTFLLREEKRHVMKTEGG